MYLINVQAILDFEKKKAPLPEVFEHFYQMDLDKIQYAVLSHCWCTAGENELPFHEIKNLTIDAADKLQKLDGYQRILGACKKAYDDGIEWLWAMPYCVPWGNGTDVSEAVNAMYRWCANSKRCYAYLHDVNKDHPFIETSINNSKWFLCSWTLQPSIACRDMEFVDCNWTKIRNKANMAPALSSITGIPEQALTDGLPGPYNPCRPSVAQIMSWASKRETRRVEDQAYSLLGLFGVHLSVRYGEEEIAFQRLQEAIIKEYNNDHTIFAWFDGVRPGSVLANNPSCFLGSSDVIRLDPPVAFSSGFPATAITQSKVHERFQVAKGCIELWPPVILNGSGNGVQAKLACRRTGSRDLIALNLSVFLDGYDGVFVRDVDSNVLFKKPVFQRLGLVFRQSRFIPHAPVLTMPPSKASIERRVAELEPSLGNKYYIVRRLLRLLSRWTANLDDWVHTQEESSPKLASPAVHRGLLPATKTLVAVKVPRVSPPAWNREDIEVGSKISTTCAKADRCVGSNT